MKRLVIVVFSLGLLLTIPTAVLAEESGASGRPVTASPKGALVSCQARMGAVQKRSTQLVQRAQNMETVFEKIAKRVEDYYNDKLVPGGVTLAKYDSLVTDIAAKKIAVDTALSDAQAKEKTFGCADVASAKAQVQAFRGSMQNVIRALKDYRTSVKNLIVAVRTASGSLKSPAPSESPES